MRGCGAPSTAAWATSGCVKRKFSTSVGNTLKPPTWMTSVAHGRAPPRSVRVDLADVAGAKPAVAGRRRPLAAAVVAGRDACAADLQLAVAHPQLVAGHARGPRSRSARAAGRPRGTAQAGPISVIPYALRIRGPARVEALDQARRRGGAADQPGAHAASACGATSSSPANTAGEPCRIVTRVLGRARARAARASARCRPHTIVPPETSTASVETSPNACEAGMTSAVRSVSRQREQLGDRPSPLRAAGVGEVRALRCARAARACRGWRRRPRRPGRPPRRR